MAGNNSLQIIKYYTSIIRTLVGGNPPELFICCLLGSGKGKGGCLLPTSSGIVIRDPSEKFFKNQKANLLLHSLQYNLLFHWLQYIYKQYSLRLRDIL